MWSDCSRSLGPSETSGMALQVIWDVDADTTYDVQCGNRPQEQTLIAVRTCAGQGEMHVAGHDRFDLAGGSLLMVERSAIRRYRTQARRWTFWWFEFTVGGPLPFPLYRRLVIPPRPGDAREFTEMFAALRRETFLHRCLASASFNRLMCRWMASWEGTVRSSPHRDTVQAVVRAMHERLTLNWTVDEMADFAHLSVRRFRQVFRAETGQSPKQFYDNLRLSMAREMLRLGIHNVREVAGKLGFSDAFHFSKVFKRYAGTPPSSVEA